MKIVVNRCYGGFCLSVEAEQWLLERGERTPYDLARDNPLLIEVVETLGEKANGSRAELEVVDIPDDVKWEIDEYDGHEQIAEKHRRW